MLVQKVKVTAVGDPVAYQKKENESEAQFDIRCKRMEDNLMQVMLDVLDDCDYYIKGTQNSQKTQK